MPGTLDEWTVTPHAAPEQVADDILTAVGDLEMPLMTLPRRMTVVRLKDGRLAIFSAIALDEAEMRRLEDFGTPAFLGAAPDPGRPWRGDRGRPAGRAEGARSGARLKAA